MPEEEVFAIPQWVLRQPSPEQRRQYPYWQLRLSSSLVIVVDPPGERRNYPESYVCSVLGPPADHTCRWKRPGAEHLQAVLAEVESRAAYILARAASPAILAALAARIHQRHESDGTAAPVGAPYEH